MSNDLWESLPIHSQAEETDKNVPDYEIKYTYLEKEPYNTRNENKGTAFQWMVLGLFIIVTLGIVGWVLIPIPVTTSDQSSISQNIPALTDNITENLSNQSQWTRNNFTGVTWNPRYQYSTISLLDGSILLIGGYPKATSTSNDTWMSTDNGYSWKLINQPSKINSQDPNWIISNSSKSTIIMWNNTSGTTSWTAPNNINHVVVGGVPAEVELEAAGHHILLIYMGLTHQILPHIVAK